jgi:hypothetical protein
MPETPAGTPQNTAEKPTAAPKTRRMAFQKKGPAVIVPKTPAPSSLREKNLAIGGKTTIPPDTNAALMASGVLVDRGIRDSTEKAPVIPKKIVCDLCRSPYVNTIVELYQGGKDVKEIMRLYGVSPAQIRVHLTHMEAAEKLEASVESVSSYMNTMRDRGERIFSRLEGMLETISSGLIADMTPDGQIILSKPTITQIKPATDSMVKVMAELRQIVEIFAKVNAMYTPDDSHSGPTINIIIPQKRDETAMVLDAVVTANVSDPNSRTVRLGGEVLSIHAKSAGLIEDSSEFKEFKKSQMAELEGLVRGSAGGNQDGL